jgi:hypothetical protein
MKRSEKSLLNSLRNIQPTNSEETLRNVKNSLGSLGKAVGNPLTKNELSITTDVYYCDVALHVLIAPAALPLANQNSPIPVWYFGLTDMYGAYQKARFLAPLDNVSWFYLNSGFWNYNLFAGIDASVLIAGVNDGDYLVQYVCMTNGNLRAVIRISCQNVAYATLVHSLMSDIIFLNTIRYSLVLANILQFANSLKIGHLSTFGKLNIDTIDPRLYILPTSPQQTISDIPVKIPIDKSIIIATFIEITCQHFNFILFVEKIEVLTKRS